MEQEKILTNEEVDVVEENNEDNIINLDDYRAEPVVKSDAIGGGITVLIGMGLGALTTWAVTTIWKKTEPWREKRASIRKEKRKMREERKNDPIDSEGKEKTE